MQIDKKGRKFRVKKSNVLFFDAGTVDKETLKSIYLGFSGQFKSIDDNTRHAIRIFNWNVKQIIHKTVKESPFHDKYILVSDFPDNLVETKNGFFQYNLTLFPKTKTNELLGYVSKLCDSLEMFCSNKEYFHISNKRKQIKW